MTLRIDDHTVTVTLTAATVAGTTATGTDETGTEFHVPIGPVALLDGPLGRADPPSPASLTNALGLVTDHLDDIIIAAPAMAAPTSVVAVGEHALALARVEIGQALVPNGYQLSRADADEVFRTLVAETIDDRRHNPGLDHHHVESIIGTCCVILGVMRRLDLTSITITPPIDAVIDATVETAGDATVEATVVAGAGR
jgi:exopolyphosphatase/pppGpp-phosphohydrolase